MKSGFVVRAAAGLAVLTAMPGHAPSRKPPGSPGSEIVGQPVQVTTNGVTNTVYLDPGGSARIMTPGGNTVPGTWSAANGQLCLSNGAAQECCALYGAVPGRTAADADQLVQRDLDLACAGDQRRPPPGPEGRARALSQLFKI